MRNGSGVRWPAAVAMMLVILFVAHSRVFAVNSVVVESKSFAPGQTACSVGVFITNDVPIVAIALPLELRTTLGPGYLSVPTPSSFRFRLAEGNRVDQSPLGGESELWPPPVVVASYHAQPYDGTEPRLSQCGGPISSSYYKSTPSADGVSPDAIFYVTVSTGDPNLSEECCLPAGTDPPGTENASFIFVFNVSEETGCFRIDTCCKTPATHLSLVDNDVRLLNVEFERAVIQIGEVVCPGVTDPELNHPPLAQCVDSLVIRVGEECEAYLTDATLIDAGSYDMEDGSNIAMSLDRTGPFRPGRHSIELTVCDQDMACVTCMTTLVVLDTLSRGIDVQPDTLSFLYDDSLGLYDLCDELPVVYSGCASFPKIESITGDLVEAHVFGAVGREPILRVCVNGLLAAQSPSGTYAGRVVLALQSRPERDTLVIVIDVVHPPLPPGCETVCGFVLNLDGEPVWHARVGALTCNATWTRCATVPGVGAFTDSSGAFCVQAGQWSRLRIVASAPGFNPVLSQEVDCPGQPVYLYATESGIIFPGEGPRDAVPTCATQGFVFEMTDAGTSMPAVGAVVELWDWYPGGSILLEDSTDGFGHFGLRQLSGALVVRKAGYCPTLIGNISCGFGPISLTLDPISFSAPADWPYFTDYSSSNATFAGFPILRGDAIYATDPQGVICGAVWVEDAGSFNLRVIGDDPNTATDEGAVPGDVITLWLNCDYVVTVPVTWENAGNSQFDLAWSTESEVAIDILPGVCPNVIDTGVTQLPSPVRPEPAGGAPTEEPSIEVAILGTASLDAPNVDLASVQFEGLSPLSHQLADVSRPPSLETQSDCACPETGSDGLVDLVLKFDQRELLDALGELHDGEVRTLTFAGNTKRGRTLSGADCLTVKFGPVRANPGGSRNFPGNSNLATYPNPFNAEAVISFRLEAAAQVRVDIFDVLGRKVTSLVDDIMPVGEHRVSWDASHMASGVYFVRIITAEGQTIKKLVLVR